MKSTINYDFELSRAVCTALSELSDDLEKATSHKLSDDTTQLNSAWISDNATKFVNKHKNLMKQYKQLCESICKQSEELERLSRRLFVQEQTAKEIARRREYGVD